MSFFIENKEENGIVVDAAAAKKILNSHYEFLLEHGRLRYFKWCGNEFIRMIHIAVRDENWMTIPYVIRDLQIDDKDGRLVITFTAQYATTSIQFTAAIKIIAENNSLNFSFTGSAESGFLKNRIGICLLLPVEVCSDQQCVVTHPDGSQQQGVFPERISPHQPLKNISAIKWQTKQGINIETIFANEIFEMEDQRNWSDHSYKIYGTPLDIPFPVKLNTGDCIEQSAILNFHFPVNKMDDNYLTLHKSIAVNKFPLLGLQHNEKIFNYPEAKRLLGQLKIHHLRIEISFAKDWEFDLLNCFTTAAEIGAAVELVLILADENIPADQIYQQAASAGVQILSLLILSHGQNITDPVLFSAIKSKLRKYFTAIPIGAGTAFHYAEINRYNERISGAEFMAFPINPQVHADDSLTIIENLQAFHDIINNTSDYYGDLQIHISRLTLRYPFNPDSSGENKYDSIKGKPWTEDHRQYSLFCAAWVILSLKYLSGVNSITLFDCMGPSGVINDTSNNSLHTLNISPVWLVLSELAAFGAIGITDITSSQPLIADGVCFVNGQGRQLFVLVNWKSEAITIDNDVFDYRINIMVKSLNIYALEAELQSPENWIGLQYQQYTGLVTDKLKIGAGEILFARIASGSA